MSPLRTWRHRLGLTQVALAERLDADISTVKRWEAGRRDPDPWIWLALAAIEAGAPVPPEAPKTTTDSTKE